MSFSLFSDEPLSVFMYGRLFITVMSCCACISCLAALS